MPTHSVLASSLLLAVVLSPSAYALKTEDRNLQPNNQVDYLKIPGEANSFGEMIAKGEIYGRMRSNMFWYDWERQKDHTSADNNQWGLGGNLVYKTAFLKGFGATAGFYGAVPMVSENIILDTNNHPVNIGKTGKDTYRTRPDGSESPIGVVAEAYLEYKNSGNNLKIGRQTIETILMASNDTKMIPNTFTATIAETKAIPDTRLRGGYVTSQKLRDHQEFHSIIAYEKLTENDDSGAHQGLTPALISKYGANVNPGMLVISAENKSIPKLKLNGEYYRINGFFSTAIAEANYAIELTEGWTLTPGVRYLRQMDDGAGIIGGASIKGSFSDNYSAATTKGYTNPNSADGSFWAARMVLAKGALSMMAGCSKIADDADIIAPWRGFPTAGYSRSMAQVDWIANTRTWMVKADYDFAKANLIPGLKISADYASMNYDDAKMLAGSSAYSDRTIFHLDAISNFSSLPNTEFKFRFASVNADPVLTSTTVDRTDYASYNEYRFEMNYLF